MTLNFEKEKLVKKLKERNPKKVLVQLPEGIKQNVIEINEIFNELGIKVIFSGETAWGGCDIAFNESKNENCDLIVHFGHAKFIENQKILESFPEVVYIEIKDELDLIPLLEKSLEFLKKFNKIGFSFSIQHKHDSEKIIKFYEKNKKKVIISKKQGFVVSEGHVVGCQYEGLKKIEKNVECFVIIGNQFHSLGAILAVQKPVFLIDVYNGEIKNMRGLKEKIIKQRAIAIQKLKDAKNVGIIIETKPGQKFGSSEYLFKKLKEKGKNPLIITMNELAPEKIMNFYNIDVFIELACPRIAIDDFEKYSKNLLTFKESLVALDIKSWKDFLKEGIL